MRIAKLVFGAALVATAACGSSPTRPTASEPLPLVSETASMRYYHEPGDAIEVGRQELFNAWAVESTFIQH